MTTAEGATPDWEFEAADESRVRNMRIGAVKEPARRDIPQYAMQAVFEAVVNAVANRDYSVPGSKIQLPMDRRGEGVPIIIPTGRIGLLRQRLQLS